MQKVKYSIISTCFNGEKYLGRALDSLCNQTYKNFELILIDDGSTDNSKKIIEEYCGKYEFIRAYYTENRGALSARSLGIYYASGDYLLFMDCDDEYLPITVETIDRYISEYQCDILVYGYFRVQTDGRISQIFDSKSSVLTDKKEQLIKLLTDSTYNPLWRKAIRKKLLHGSLDERRRVRVANDLFMSIDAYESAERVLFISECLYKYYIINSSTIHGVKYENYSVSYYSGEKSFDVIDRIGNFTEDDYAVYKTICLSRILNQANGVCSFNTKFENKKDIFDEIKRNHFYTRVTDNNLCLNKLKLVEKINYWLFRNSYYKTYVIFNCTITKTKRELRTVRGKFYDIISRR